MKMNIFPRQWQSSNATAQPLVSDSWVQGELTPSGSGVMATSPARTISQNGTRGCLQTACQTLLSPLMPMALTCKQPLGHADGAVTRNKLSRRSNHQADGPQACSLDWNSELPLFPFLPTRSAMTSPAAELRSRHLESRRPANALYFSSLHSNR